MNRRQFRQGLEGRLDIVRRLLRAPQFANLFGAFPASQEGVIGIVIVPFTIYGTNLASTPSYSGGFRITVTNCGPYVANGASEFWIGW